MEKYFKEVVAEDETKTYEEVPVFKSFENEEEFNKTVQSASSKAKGEILSELGIKSVAEFKDKYKGIEELDALKGNLTEKEKLFTETKSAYDKLQEDYKAATNELSGLKETVVLSKYEVPKGFINDFKTLVKAGVKPKTETEEGVSFEESAKQVYERLNITQTKNKIQIGGPGKVDKKTMAEEMEALRKL